MAGFAGDDFGLAVAALEQVVFHNAGSDAHGVVALPDLDAFEAVAAAIGAVHEVVVIDAVLSVDGLELYLNGDATVGLGSEEVVVDAIVGAVEANPSVAAAGVGGIAGVENAVA